MRNLLKYEIKDGFFPYLVMAVVFCVAVVGIVAMIKLGNGQYIFTSHSDLPFVALCAGIFWFLLIFSVVGFGVVQVINIINAFGKNLFGAYGYLLFCLPLGIDRILLSKVLGCFILIGASFVYCAVLGFGAFVYISDFRLLGVVGEFFERLSRVDLGISVAFFATHLSYYLCSILGFLLQVLLTLAVLNFLRVSSFRFGVGIGIFIGISIITDIVGTVCYEALNIVGILPLSTQIGGFWDSFFIFSMQKDNFVDFMKDSLRISLVIYNIFSYILTSLAYYLIARYLIMRKLELE